MELDGTNRHVFEGDCWALAEVCTLLIAILVCSKYESCFKMGGSFPK